MLRIVFAEVAPLDVFRSAMGCVSTLGRKTSRTARPVKSDTRVSGYGFGWRGRHVPGPRVWCHLLHCSAVSLFGEGESPLPINATGGSGELVTGVPRSDRGSYRGIGHRPSGSGSGSDTDTDTVSATDTVTGSETDTETDTATETDTDTVAGNVILGQ